jgi:hypothetical protein
LPEQKFENTWRPGESLFIIHKQELEVQAVQQLTEYRSERVASGMEQVIEACNLLLARRLFIDNGLEKDGFVCRQQSLHFS